MGVDMFSFIIVHWNTKNDLHRCLTSLATFCSDSQIIVVDNASTDGTADMVRTEFPSIQLIQNSANLGFATANNQGIARATGDWVVLLNPDTELTQDPRPAVIACGNRHDATGIVACALRNADGSIQPSLRRFPTIPSQVGIMLKVHHLLPKLKSFQHYFANDVDYTREQQADQPAGAFLAIHRSVLEKVGLLDNHYWIWFEDVDYCLRAKKAGFEIWYTPEASVTHFGGVAFSKKPSFQKQKMFQRSLVLYMMKHKGKAAGWLFMMLYPLGLMLAGVSQVFHIKKKNYVYTAQR